MSALLERSLPDVHQVKAELSRRNLIEFTRYTFPTFRENWHHLQYAAILDRFANKEIKKLMVWAPPQHTKSEFSSRRLPAKMLGDNPNLRIGIIAYNHSVASKFNRDVQRIIDSPEYQNIYPATTISPLNSRTPGGWIRNAEEFEIIDKEGSLVSVGIGGGLTSRKLDIAIIDDPYKDASSAWSQKVRDTLWDWYWSVLRTRLHNESQELLVFTRWHEEDLAGKLLEEEPDDWVVFILEALRSDRINNENDPREIGEALWPDQLTVEKLEKIKKSNNIVFESLYQQNPTPKEGLLLPSSDLKRFSLSQLMGSQPDGIVSVCDIADEGDDSLCHPVGFIFGEQVYVVDVIFTKDPIEATQPRVAEVMMRYNIDRSRFESNAGGRGYALKVKELVKQYRGRTDISWKTTTANKHTRIVMKSGDIKESFYFLVDEEQGDEYRNYFHELTHYPKNGIVAHDDAADGTTMLAEFIMDIGARPSIRVSSLGKRNATRRRGR